MILRDVEVAGRAGLDVRLEDGRIAEIAPRIAAAGEAIDGRRGALIPGLADHHLHLFALAARADSVDLTGASEPRHLAERIARAAAERPAGAWIRAIGYHETMAGALARDALDRLAPRHPLRVQHQTGSLWMFNSLAVDRLAGADPPAGLERGDDGRPTGRLWRADAWLRTRLEGAAPPLAPIGRRLAAYGLTALTDASVTTDPAAAELLAGAVRRGELPQRLRLMSGGALEGPADAACTLGEVKLLLDDHDLPPVEEIAATIARARSWGRGVAVHCVTAAELAITLAAFDAAGARPGDRIEHGGAIPQAAIGQLRALGLTVVTQPGFIHERGDRYAAEVPVEEHADLYRCASLKAAGVPVAGSSDAPYASADPWTGIAAAVRRETRGGVELGAAERIDPAAALALYLGPPEAPGGPPRRVAVGAAADLCLLNAPLREVLAEPSAEWVRATLVGGQLTFGPD